MSAILEKIKQIPRVSSPCYTRVKIYIWKIYTELNKLLLVLMVLYKQIYIFEDAYSLNSSLFRKKSQLGSNSQFQLFKILNPRQSN